MQEELSHKIKRQERIIKSGKLGRFLNNPFRWLLSGLWRDVFYKITGAGLNQKFRLITGHPFHTQLPAGIDLFLFGMKSDASEIRLTKFIAKNLNEDSCFLDVGAHLGYYSLLAYHICGEIGEVHSFEPSPSTFNYLHLNTDNTKIQLVNKAVSNKEESLDFALHPILYSEYNSLKTNNSNLDNQIIQVNTEVLDNYCKEHSLSPNMIKIDVEGAELQVIQGSSAIMAKRGCTFITEVRKDQLETDELKTLLSLFQSQSYTMNRIDDEGQLLPLEELKTYIKSIPEDSDNIVFTA